MNKEPVNVDAYTRKGRRVRQHIRRAGKKVQKSFTGNRELIEIDDLDDVGILEIPSEVYQKLKAQVDNPLTILKQAGLAFTHITQLVNANGVDSNGNVLIRNRRTGEGMKMKVFNFAPGSYTPSDLSRFSEEIT